MSLPFHSFLFALSIMTISCAHSPIPEVVHSKSKSSIWKRFTLENDNLFAYILPCPRADGVDVLIVFERSIISQKEVEAAFIDKSKREKVISAAIFATTGNPDRTFSPQNNETRHILETHYELLDEQFVLCTKEIVSRPMRLSTRPEFPREWELKECASQLYDARLQDLRAMSAQPTN